MEKIKNLFFSDKVHEGIPESRFLAPDPTRILAPVTKYYEVRREDLFESRRGSFNEPRNVAIYLMRQLRDILKDAAGKIFRIKRNSTVSSVVEEVKSEMSRNKRTRGNVEKLMQILSKGQT